MPTLPRCNTNNAARFVTITTTKPAKVPPEQLDAGDKGLNFIALNSRLLCEVAKELYETHFYQHIYIYIYMYIYTYKHTHPNAK
jgi:hypothetical protein